MTSTDLEAQPTPVTQPSPISSDAPYRTPSRPMSRQSVRRRGSSPGPASSPPPLPQQDSPPDERESVDVVTDENISPLDPRRFTPTLHASLVSEILSLRREVESKGKVIDALESSLEDSRAENEGLNESLSGSAKEIRSLKRQMQLLEGGTLSALTDLAKERDEAVDNISDVCKRLELAQKKVRTQEGEEERIQMLWDRDKQSWETERRNWERKVHVVENRLKLVLNEVAAAPSVGWDHSVPEGDLEQSTSDSAIRESDDATSLRSSSVLGKRRASMTSISSQGGEPPTGRFSAMSVANGHVLKANGLNLADELAFDEEEEHFGEHAEDDMDPHFSEELPEERPTSVQSQTSYAVGMKARKILGLSFGGGPDRSGTPDAFEQARKGEIKAPLESERTPPARQVDYRDVGIQFSPPPSPQLPPQPLALQQEAEEPSSSFALEDASPDQPERDPENVPVPPATHDYHTRDSGTVTSTVDMVSSSCQTISDLPSPPWTPIAATQSILGEVEASMISVSTQTEEVVIIAPGPQNEPQQYHLPIPKIAIHPPGSEPPSPRNSVVLPPHTKNISCQTDFTSLVEVKSVAMQTEEIRIDKRPVKLPASLLPSAIPDRLNAVDSREISAPFRGPPPRSSKRALSKPSGVEKPSKTHKGKQPEKIQSYPGNNNDTGPLTEDPNSDIRRPLRSSSLFAGFEGLSDEEVAETDVFSDDELFNRPMAFYTLKSGKLVTKTGRPSFDDNPLREMDEPRFSSETELQEGPATNEGLPLSTIRNGVAGSSKRPPRVPKMAAGSKQPDIRRTAMISNGAAAHQRTRPRSPSEPSIESSLSGASKPPFPVPVRLSSRKGPVSGREGAQSPTPSSNGTGNAAERRGRRLARQPTLRKVRSATTISPGERTRSRSPSVISPSSYTPDSPQLPPMPFDDITAPRRKRSAKKLPNRTPSAHPQSHAREDSVTAAVQPTSVVDAIAQTMVGEWMFKYVRRRKSFGMSESKDAWELGKSTEELSANITSSGVRHKRWVWLAPYERAVMWSSRQPTSGTALLGKSGRKLTIQSVLDVKDDTPLPKGAIPNLFNRSILILTPQRALKFTALTLERHYVWLTALSFLSHSTMGIQDLAALPPVPKEGFVSPPPTATLRRNPIRDSIRVAKGKPRPKPGEKRSFTAHPGTVPELPGIGIDVIDPIMDAADPPNVPRFSSHSRKRSNTAPRAPPSAFRSFTSHTTMPSTYSATTAGSSDIYPPSSIVAPGFNSGQSSFSRRTSEASGPSSVGTVNFFEAVGTVRMEAFIDRTHMARHRGNYRSRHGAKKRDSNHWGSGHHDLDFARSEDGSEAYFRNDDPFRGF
ncbi:hypothetical protein Egran_02012 [Elaphomyces granulatus]|uniref:Pleckstrin homology domain-containing protein n=1 Tax=Elaphomyces granulatus TaxID=519963 RepID=A0A232M2B9_9EURO|nr:hypothetical protein Egran_02012 [Elaphomyces granulatus]